VNIDGVHNMEEFEVIKIVDDSQPYPMLMGLEWVFDNQEIINLKKEGDDIQGWGYESHCTFGPIRRTTIHRANKREGH
jgi:hypothetical protein